MSDARILWRWEDRPGHDAAALTHADGLWLVSGSAVFVEANLPVRLDYRVVCDEQWRTRSASVEGRVGRDAVSIDITANADGEWRLNGNPQPAVFGCTDVDLNFSPVTNLLPVRRLELRVGDEASVRAAWLRFPSFDLEVLEQVYRRVAEDLYEYESNGGAYKTTIQVNDAGLPVNYAGIWRAVASA